MSKRVSPESIFVADSLAEGPARPLSEWGENGLLWLVNATVFWPRGFALGLAFREDPANGDEYLAGYNIEGDGTEPFAASTEEMAQQRFEAVEALFARLKKESSE